MKSHTLMQRSPTFIRDTDMVFRYSRCAGTRPGLRAFARILAGMKPVPPSSQWGKGTLFAMLPT